MKFVMLILIMCIQLSVALDFTDKKIRLIQSSQDRDFFDEKEKIKRGLLKVRKEVLSLSPLINNWNEKDQNAVANYFLQRYPDSIQARNIYDLLSKKEQLDPIAKAVYLFNAIHVNSDYEKLNNVNEIGAGLEINGLPLYWLCQFWELSYKKQLNQRKTNPTTFNNWTNSIKTMIMQLELSDEKKLFEQTDTFHEYWSHLNLQWRIYFRNTMDINAIQDSSIKIFLEANSYIDSAFVIEKEFEKQDMEIPAAAKSKIEMLMKKGADISREFSKVSNFEIWPGQLILFIHNYIDLKPDEAKYWLNYGLRNQFEMLHVLRAYQNYILKSKYSNDALVYEFVFECMNTGRFDTYVPYISIETMREYGRKFKDAGLLFRKPGMFDMVKHYYSYRIPEMDKELGFDRGTRTQLLCIALLCNEIEIAREIWKSINGDVHLPFCKMYGLTKSQIQDMLNVSK